MLLGLAAFVFTVVAFLAAEALAFAEVSAAFLARVALVAVAAFLELVLTAIIPILNSD